MTKIEENEAKCPELVGLRQVVENKSETDDRRYRAAWCYTMIALALNTENYIPHNLT